MKGIYKGMSKVIDKVNKQAVETNSIWFLFGEPKMPKSMIEKMKNMKPNK